MGKRKNNKAQNIHSFNIHFDTLPYCHKLHKKIQCVACLRMDKIKRQANKIDIMLAAKLKKLYIK